MRGELHHDAKRHSKHLRSTSRRQPEVFVVPEGGGTRRRTFSPRPRLIPSGRLSPGISNCWNIVSSFRAISPNRSSISWTAGPRPARLTCPTSRSEFPLGGLGDRLVREFRSAAGFGVVGQGVGLRGHGIDRDRSGLHRQILGDGTPGSVGLSGSYTLNDQPLDQGSYALTATDLSASVPNVLSASASDVQLQYSPSGSGSQEIAQVGSLTATIIPLESAQVSLTDLDIYENGFTLGDATVGAGSFTLGGFLDVDNPSLSFSNVAYTDGGSLSGTISIAVGTATLFPNQSLFSATVDGFQGAMTSIPTRYPSRPPVPASPSGRSSMPR